MGNMMIKREAREILRGRWLFAIGVHLIMQVITVMLGSAVTVGSILITGLASVGLCSVSLRLVRREPVSVSDAFDGLRQGLVNNLVAGILVSLFTFLWSLLFIIPGIVKSYSYSMTYFILRDNPDMRSLDAIDLSQKMMQGNKMRLFMLDISFIFCYLAVLSAAIFLVVRLTMMNVAFLIFGIVVIIILLALAVVITPYRHVAHAVFYEEIKNQF